MAGKRLSDLAIGFGLVGALTAGLLTGASPSAEVRPGPNFVTSDRCIACHSGMVDADGETLSIGHTWRASMMALAAKDPYWQAAVRREIADRPEMQAEIEDVCSVCHMPMFRTRAVADGRSGEILRYIEGNFTKDEMKIASDGVSCSVCHQISEENLGEHASFDGGYRINPSLPEQGLAYGPYEVTAGHKRLMHSASALFPAQSTHVQRSELCASCHTLFTPAMDAGGEIIGEFPEQMPYLEWRHSDYRETASCQSCHMPEAEGSVPIASILGEPRENVSRHVFRGGNAFMLGLLDKYREDLGVSTPSEDLDRSIRETLAYLESASAELEIEGLRITETEAEFDVRVVNKAGHKLPTAYPSRRAWLHVTVRDQAGRAIFESGALGLDGAIKGNDNDVDSSAFEPHYNEIFSSDQVQIYEPIIHDFENEVTTSLLAGVRYIKDNRLLPSGFDKSTADDSVAVRGRAYDDPDFRAGGDRIRYRIELPGGVTDLSVSAELLYQTIGYRWAANLAAYDSAETERFTGYYRSNASQSAVVLATASGR